MGTESVGTAGHIADFHFDERDLRARFDFGGCIGQNGSPCVSFGQQQKFQEDFKKQLAEVQALYEWLSPDFPSLPPRVTSGPYQPESDFHIFVSETYNKSRALVPLWLGQRGWMEFSAHRVAAGEATIAHELVHVLFPNGNRLLAEGLAVYLQDKLSVCLQDGLSREKGTPIPVYPNYGDCLEAVVADFLYRAYPRRTAYAIWNMDLNALEKISTPDDLHMRIGRDPFVGGEPGGPPPDPRQSKFIYAVAGSFVGFLLENPIEDDLLTKKNFAALYGSTPVRPLERDPGSPDRWEKFYQGKGRSYSFSELGMLWKTYLHFVLCSKISAGKQGAPIPKRFETPLVKKAYAKLNELCAK
jgi:hypothetical protein